jgi:uncharacterized cysteine cluster protein YcgN (CxxCxxCC family)
MDDQQWESLCDGCARCCLEKLEDHGAGLLHFTRVACQLLDVETCRCTDYGRRSALVPDCLRLRPDMGADFEWLPVTCAYRLLHEGSPLPDWHPLVSGDPESVHRAGISVRGLAVSKAGISHRMLEEMIILSQDLQR